MHGSLETMSVEVDLCAPGWERIIDKSPPIEVIARDIIFGEGPVWDARNKRLFFVDIIGDTIWCWKPGMGQNVVLNPSVKANGLALDLENRLVVAGWGGRTVFRHEKNGSWKTLAAGWQGKKLNSPNDIVGMVGPDVQRYLETQPVFRISADGQTLSIICEDNVYPNGLCFSPDEKILYVNCTRERVIRAYDVNTDGTVGKARIFYQYTGPERGAPDGMKCDVAGNVWCTAPGGIWVHDPSGKPIVRIKTPGHHPTNFAFGDDDWKSLYITNIGSVTRTRLNIAGVPSR